MTLSYAMLLDGGFLRYKLSKRQTLVDAAAISALRKGGPTLQIDADDLEPNIRQKGVTMRIGLDIASLTLKKHAQVIVLVTADSDFVPAMKFARREGAQLVLITLGHGIRDGLREHADLVIDQPPSLGQFRTSL
ncbi:MAG TPA: NYN domain-containing protein [Steroidobacteraceae bacterium]|nr:NYN domain-containing protein [Steroidobacteraceae bacterium]